MVDHAVAKAGLIRSRHPPNRARRAVAAPETTDVSGASTWGTVIVPATLSTVLLNAKITVPSALHWKPHTCVTLGVTVPMDVGVAPHRARGVAVRSTPPASRRAFHT